MPFRNDQLVGCLTDIEGDSLDDLISLPDQNSNQHQYNRYIVDSNRLPIETELNQLNSNRNQFEVGQNTQFNQTYLNSRRSTNFNFTSDYAKPVYDQAQLNFNSQQSLATTAFDLDDELELNHLKDLEDLMDITQINQLGVNSLNNPPIQNTISQISPISQCKSQITSNVNQLNANQANNNQITSNQPTQQFSSQSSHPTFDNFTSTSAQLTNARRTNSSNLQVKFSFISN